MEHWGINEKMIKLTKFLLACDVPLNLENYKVHLATGQEYPPLAAFFDGKFKEWQEGQSRKNFKCDMVIGLIELEKYKWLFGGVYRILGCGPQANSRYTYSTELLPNQEELIGRIIVYHKRSGRASYLWGAKDGGEFNVCEVREKPLSVEDFPGYHAITVSYSKLRTIVSQNIPSWRGALGSIKGVYLIADTKTGLLYVGSALGTSGIWQRWRNYAQTGHGGNRELKTVIEREGNEYAQHFQYSILEIADTYASDDYVLSRESYWKQALQTRTFGYNRS